ncbi:MAG: hypothetical protein JWN86_1341 [Planctomycetota bacterium]|nr:hypothetical protein [Planctomycetota bacterium]
MKLLTFRLCSLFALGVCASLQTDYLLANAAFCGVRHGCDEVIFSSYGRPLGVPLPAAGLIAFGLFFGMTFVPPATRLLTPVAILAGFAGIGLFAIQWLALKRFCPLCLLVDLGAMLLAITELALPSPRQDGASTPPAGESPVSGLQGIRAVSRPRCRAWAAAACLSVTAPLAWGVLQPKPPVPDAVKALWKQGVITVVEVTDFECPFCRRNHEVMASFLKDHGTGLRFVRRIHPLPHHPNARSAARAYLAAERQGRAEAMAHDLFTTNDLSPDGCEQLAKSLGLDMDEYRACLSDRSTDIEIEIEKHSAWLDRGDLKGLPLIWVHDQMLVGLQTPEGLGAALRRAERSIGSRTEGDRR